MLGTNNIAFMKVLDFGGLSEKFFLMLAFILVASFLINFFLSRSFLGRMYRIFVAPGIILHEFSHALLCVLTGAKISKIALFEKEGGSVQHTPPKIPIIGQILISLAPIAFGSTAIFFLSKKIGINEVDITALSMTKEGLINFFRSSISGLDVHNLYTWIIVYLVLSIAVTLTPSIQDLRNIALSVIFIIAVIVLAYKFTSFKIPAFSIPEQITILLSTVSFLLILALILSIILFAVSKLINK